MLTRSEARELLAKARVDIGADFFTLSTDQKIGLLDAAKLVKYKPSKYAPGSKARMFHQYLQRRANAKETWYGVPKV